MWFILKVLSSYELCARTRVCVCAHACEAVLSHVRLFVTPWNVALQAPLSCETKLFAPSQVQWWDRHRIDVPVSEGENQKEETDAGSQAKPKPNKAKLLR